MSSGTEILKSFKEEYHPHLLRLPMELQPASTTHGVYSFTKMIPNTLARVEILLRHRALKPKADVDGRPVRNVQPLGVLCACMCWARISFEQSMEEAVRRCYSVINYDPAI